MLKQERPSKRRGTSDTSAVRVKGRERSVSRQICRKSPPICDRNDKINHRDTEIVTKSRSQLSRSNFYKRRWRNSWSVKRRGARPTWPWALRRDVLYSTVLLQNTVAVGRPPNHSKPQTLILKTNLFGIKSSSSASFLYDAI